ncbi:MAG TPA: molybdenum cofactor guanylyltransferase [Bacteroidales bacterium]|nr:molybdenum cofactor guanylyltransferase [Bacteroidales bacterium]
MNVLNTTGKHMLHSIAGVILAGGASKRFNGIIKAKIVIDGRTIISRIIGTMNELFDEIIIVTNTPDEFKEYSKCKIAGDRFLNKGPLGGIHSAMINSSCDAMFIVAGDMPLLEKDIIIKQIEYFNHNNFDVVIPRINNFTEPLHGIYKKSLLRKLEAHLEVETDYSIRAFLKKTDISYLQFEESENTKKAFLNINSSSDIAIVERLLDPTK